VPGTRGYDKGKQVNGRKRHILVDTLGLLVAVVGTAASVQDRDGARPVPDLFKQSLGRTPHITVATPLECQS
jgi:hypothetical protein